MKALKLILVMLLFSQVHAQTMQEMYDNAQIGENYDKLIILEKDVIYTGGFLQDVKTVCIHGNGAIIDIAGEAIIVSGQDSILDIDHCIFMTSVYSPGDMFSPGGFLKYQNNATGNIINNTFYGATDTYNADCAVAFSECNEGVTFIQNNVFIKLYSYLAYISSVEMINVNEHLYVSNNLAYECDTGYIWWAGWTGFPSEFIPYPVYEELREDPLFISIEELDFSLTEGSPCIDRGVIKNFDYNGYSPDMGAIESPYSVFRYTRISGEISGELIIDESPYLIEDDIIILEALSLTINPGVHVKVNTDKQIKVNGELQITGNDYDSVYITNNSIYMRYWGGIAFTENAPNTSRISKAVFMKCDTAISSRNQSITIEHSRFDSCGAIYCKNESAPVIQNNIFYSNYYGDNRPIIGLEQSTPQILVNEFYNGRLFASSANPYIAGNYFYSSKIELQNNSNSYIENNYFNTTGTSIYINNSNGLCINNIIQSKTKGFYITNTSQCSITNNTILLGFLNYTARGVLCTNESITNITNSVVWSLIDSISTMSALKHDETSEIISNYCELFTYYEGDSNIFTDPYFTDPENNDFCLLPNSPCINAGTPDTSGLNLPEYDYAGLRRVFESRIDIGAYEYNFPVGINKTSQTKWTLECYPNPVKNRGSIVFAIPKNYSNTKITVTLYNTKGVLVKQICNKTYSTGKYILTLNTESLKEGIYICELKSSDFKLTKKIILAK